VVKKEKKSVNQKVVLNQSPNTLQVNVVENVPLSKEEVATLRAQQLASLAQARRDLPAGALQASIDMKIEALLATM
jgi:hypothetical protein